MFLALTATAHPALDRLIAVRTVSKDRRQAPSTLADHLLTLRAAASQTGFRRS